MNSPSRPARRLVFSVATNGYERRFAGCLATHRRLADAMDADCWVATGAPPWGISANDSGWLKVSLIRSALNRGFEWVVFMDADCEVLETASPVDAFVAASADIFVAHDFTHRINSAVLIVRNTPVSRRVFRRLELSAWIPPRLLPAMDRNLYENGHVIRFFKNEPAVQVVSDRWNCSAFSTDPKSRQAVILHHGGTDMRPVRSMTRAEKWREIRHTATTALRLARNRRYFEGAMPFPVAANGLIA